MVVVGKGGGKKGHEERDLEWKKICDSWVRATGRTDVTVSQIKTRWANRKMRPLKAMDSRKGPEVAALEAVYEFVAVGRRQRAESGTGFRPETKERRSGRAQLDLNDDANVTSFRHVELHSI